MSAVDSPAPVNSVNGQIGDVVLSSVDIGAQPLDATLTALAAYNTNGLLTQTAADTFTGRTLTGTANQITVTNGDGVAGNPVLSLPQNIATTSSPTLGGLTLSAANSTTVPLLTMTPTGTLASGTLFSKFNGDRPWQFRQNGTGASAALELNSTTDLKSFLITSATGTTAVDVHVSNTATTGYMNISLPVGLGTAAPTHTLTLPSTATGIAIYNTSDQVTDYQRTIFSYSGISAQQGGTGAIHDIQLATGGGTLTLSGGGTLVNINRPNTTASELLRVTSTSLQASSGTQYGLRVDPAINQSGSASYADVYINVSETATGSGTKDSLLIKRSGTNIFRVDNNGNAVFSSGATSGITLFNTADETTNFEKGFLAWSGNVLELRASSGGTGTNRAIRLGTQAGAAGTQFLIADLASTAGFYQFSRGSSVAGANGVTCSSTWNASSDVNNIVAIAPTINQSLTAGYTALLINPTETAVGSGTKLLINAQVGGVNKLSLSSSGALTFTSPDALQNVIITMDNFWLRYTGTKGVSFDGSLNVGGGLSFSDTKNITFSTTTGTKIGIATNQKLGFWNATPIVQPTGNVMTALSNIGLVATPTLAESDVTNLTTDLAAKVSTSTTVNGHALSSNVTVTASDVGLGNVDNTSDATKNSATATLTNKRITKRSGTASAPGATPTLNTDNYDIYTFTALGANITSMTTNLSGTPVVGDEIMIGFKDDGTARTIAWGANFVSSGIATLLATTIANKQHWVKLMYDGSHWACMAVDAIGY